EGGHRSQVLAKELLVGGALDLDRARAIVGRDRDAAVVVGIVRFEDVARNDAGLPGSIPDRRLRDAEGRGQRHASFRAPSGYLLRLTRMSIRSAPVWNTLELAV